MVRGFSVLDFQKAKNSSQKITMLTAYDKITARIAEDSGVDAILVGDSLGMSVLGYDDTLSVTMEDMVRHSRAVSRSTKRAMIISDLPFMSYQISPEDALRNAGRLVVEGGCNAVKLEGGAEFSAQIKKILQAGIPVMGHLGFTPQSVNKFGGNFSQGKTAESALEIMENAYSLEDLGVFAIVLECVPHELAEAITQNLKIPTIGIGSGAECDGQVQVIYDVLGMNDGFSAKHFSRYIEGQKILTDALKTHIEDVKELKFPTAAHSFAVSTEIVNLVKRESRK